MPESGIVIGKLRETDQRYHELEELLSKPETFTDIPLYTETMKEYRSLTPVITKYREYIGVEREADEAAELARTSPDPEMRALAADELPAARKTLTAAAMTYVASLLVSFTQLLRLIASSNRRR